MTTPDTASGPALEHEVLAPSGRAGESAILSAALQVLGARGYNGMSMRDVATTAGTSLSNLYNYFPSKVDLVATLLTITNNDLLARLEAAVAGASPDATGRLRAAIGAYVAFNVEKTTASLVGISEIRYIAGNQRATVVAARDRTEQIFKEIIRDGARAGEFGTARADAAARALVTMLSAMSLWYRPEGPLGADELAAQQIDLGMALVEAR
ncbi:TetR/AcrR family transcriptional regulator [Cumulibacter manganitolerans]|uniref:TetR/AcrR family transcriptional regulator n=1 Tax=Cumulibacter manganitolerans TaxID=1884992 RepID=UPI001297AC6E|nr:TetR/AcrR family transcriptional regulator [Cumulibacter manganitolerans]